jgi:hypothetical protein
MSTKASPGREGETIRKHAREINYLVEQVGTGEFRFSYGEVVGDRNGQPIDDPPEHFDRPPWMTRPQGMIRWPGVQRTRIIQVSRPGQRTNHRVKAYRLEPWAAELAQDIIAGRGSRLPCGHSGIRNLRGGGFACAFDGCDKEFSREEVDR